VVSRPQGEGGRDTTAQLDLLDFGAALRDEGIRAVTEASDAQDIAVVDQLIREFARRRTPFSANDVRPLLPALRSNNLVGARFRCAARRGQIRRIGYVTSTDPGTHSHPVALWTGAL
jgi:hypothetical protein